MDIKNLPKKNIAYLVICGAGLFAIFLISLYANYRTLSQLEKNIVRMKAQIEEQGFFSPVFQELFKKIQFKKPEGLQLPEQARLPREDTAEILALLQEKARKNGFSVEGISPDIDSAIDGSRHLLINIILRGEFLALQSFLSQLIEVPYLEHIEQIKIQSLEGKKEIHLRIWMAKE